MHITQYINVRTTARLSTTRFCRRQGFGVNNHSNFAHRLNPLYTYEQIGLAVYSSKLSLYNIYSFRFFFPFTDSL